MQSGPQDDNPRTVSSSEALDASGVRAAMLRRMYRRSTASGQISLPAVPGMVDDYLRVCADLFAAVGVEYSGDEFAQLREVLADQLAQAYGASPRSAIVIDFHCPFGTSAHYRVHAASASVGADYDAWIGTRSGPLFGIHPDARVWDLAERHGDPASCPVLDIGAGTGRNGLTLARRGHRVDAVELAAKLAHSMRYEAQRDSLDVRVLACDIFASTAELRCDYQLIVASEVVPDFRGTDDLAALLALADAHLAPGGQLVLNTFRTRDGYVPDDTARQFGQQCNTMFFTPDEIAAAAHGRTLHLVADDCAPEYERVHLPTGAWPPTAWYHDWAYGLDLFDLEPDTSPIELRWLVFEKPTA